MEKLIQEITDSFENVPYPGNNNIGTPELTVVFKGLHWREVSPEILELRSAEITSFTPEAFHFYLPAMMLAILLHQGEIGILTETLIYRFSLSEDETNTHWNQILAQIIGLLSVPEKNAVYDFLLKCRDLYPEWAYNEYQEEQLEEAVRYWATVKDN